MGKTASDRTSQGTFRIARLGVFSGLTLAGVFIGCDQREPPKPVAVAPAPAPEPAPAPPPAPTVDAGAKVGDGGGGDVKLGLVERVNRLMAQRRAEKELAATLADEENQRLLKFDRSKVAKHVALLAFCKKARQQIDDGAAKATGKPDAAAQIEKLQASLRKSFAAQAKVLGTIDPKGGNSNITTDHEMTLQMLSADYPAAIVASLSGDGKPLEEIRKDLDKRQKKIEAWLEEIKKPEKKK